MSPADLWTGDSDTYPVFTKEQLMFMPACPATVKFLFLTYLGLDEEAKALLHRDPKVVIIAQSNHANRLGEQRALVHELWREGLQTPVVFFEHYLLGESQKEEFQLYAAADLGALLFDGLTDGIMLFCQARHGEKPLPAQVQHDTAFGILQAARLRTTKTEYISCPGCGRTLYDLPGTTNLIEEKKRYFKRIDIQEFTEEIVRHREEISEQVQALKQFERMCAAYGFDVTKPATNAREAVQWTYFGYLGAVKDQDGAAMSLGRVCAFLDIFIQRDLKNGTLTEEEAQELIDQMIMKLPSTILPWPSRTRRSTRHPTSWQVSANR